MAQAADKNLLEELLDDEDEDTQRDRYLTFRLGKEDYGIEIAHVTEIVGIQKITEVPDMPSFVKGVINLRGQVIPVIDVRVRFGMEPRDYDDRTCVVVVKVRETSIGLIVDTVSEVREILGENVSPPPKAASGTSGRYILGLGKVGEEVKILLDVQKLLFEDELAVLSA
ncbi:MAG TPA: chemotaxis protein CheW [Oligoflexia bacterium]|nr:chemotaxis protein CheW [Oligoflexia bacterium]